MSQAARVSRGSVYAEPLIDAREVGRMISPGKPLSARRVRELVSQGSRGVRLGCVQTPGGRMYTASLVAAFLQAMTEGRGPEVRVGGADVTHGSRRVSCDVSRGPLQPLAKIVPADVGRYPTGRTGWAGGKSEKRESGKAGNKGGAAALGGSSHLTTSPLDHSTTSLPASMDAGVSSAGCTGDVAAARSS